MNTKISTGNSIQINKPIQSLTKELSANLYFPLLPTDHLQLLPKRKKGGEKLRLYAPFRHFYNPFQPSLMAGWANLLRPPDSGQIIINWGKTFWGNMSDDLSRNTQANWREGTCSNPSVFLLPTSLRSLVFVFLFVLSSDNQN